MKAERKLEANDILCPSKDEKRYIVKRVESDEYAILKQVAGTRGIGLVAWSLDLSIVVYPIRTITI